MVRTTAPTTMILLLFMLTGCTGTEQAAGTWTGMLSFTEGSNPFSADETVPLERALGVDIAVVRGEAQGRTELFGTRLNSVWAWVTRGRAGPVHIQMVFVDEDFRWEDPGCGPAQSRELELELDGAVEQGEGLLWSGTARASMRGVTLEGCATDEQRESSGDFELTMEP